MGSPGTMRTLLMAVMAATLLLTTACGADFGNSAGWPTTDRQAASTPVGLGETVAFIDGSFADLQMLVMDAATGEVRFARPWTPSARSPGTGVGRPALFDSVVVGMEPDGLSTLIRGFDLATGDQLWEVEVSETFGPFVCGEFVCSEDDWSLDSAALVARNPATGEAEWSLPGAHINLYSDSELLIEVDLNEPLVRSIDPSDGRELWSTDLRSTLGPLVLPIAGNGIIVDGTLVLESTPEPDVASTTLGLNPADGSVLWSHPDFGLCPQPTPEVLAVCGAESGIRRLNPNTGEPLWSVEQFAYPRGPGPLLGISRDLSRLVAINIQFTPIAIDLDSGVISEPEAGLSWMRFVTRQTAKRNPDAPENEYLGPLDPVPWDTPGGRPATVDTADEVPDFVGTTATGIRIFMDPHGNLHGLRSD